MDWIRHTPPSKVREEEEEREANERLRAADEDEPDEREPFLRAARITAQARSQPV